MSNEEANWSMDFISDSLTNGRRIRVLNIIDDFNREALWINAQYSYPTEFVVRALDTLSTQCGLPSIIRVDNGPEFISRTFQSYCDAKQIEIQYIQPGKPTQNAYFERFKRHFRQDVLYAFLIQSKSDVNKIIENWKTTYNDNHPHSSIQRQSPNAYKELNRNDKIHYDSVKAKMNGSLGSQP